jgi:inner membrane protein
VDNLTHGLVGITAAQIALQWRGQDAASAKDQNKTRLRFWIASIFANNAPDLDFIYSRITKAPLGPLLHHRGHTHTIAAAVFIPLLALAVTWLWLKAKKKTDTWTRSDWMWIAGLWIAGTILHFSMDFMNSYGVHPFWPFDSHWYYGDTLFIVEPLLWLTLFPLAFREASSRAGKIIFGILFFFALSLTLFSGYIPLFFSVAAALLGFWSLGFMWKAPPRARAYGALTFFLGTIALFSLASNIARARLQFLSEANFPGFKTVDLILSPMPANPVCWTVLAVQTGSPDMYALRRGIFSLAPAVMGVADCPELMGPHDLVVPPLTKSQAPITPELQWHAQFQAPLSELRNLAERNCETRAFLQFARAPFWKINSENGLLERLADLRYERRQSDRNFASLSMNRNSEQCPQFTPSWIPPRTDVLTF